ncbi:MAG: hypothetical protein LLF76_07605 [Planctomycetaceae bacterium]|nr:hypothetical protein [Planctomycetaceae bacterium]
MGFFWDLLQQSQLTEHSNHAQTLETKVQYLEKDLFKTQCLLRNLIIKLEEKFGEDIDDNGIVG